MALPPTTITKAASAERDAASGATQPPSLSPPQAHLRGVDAGLRAQGPQPSERVAGELGVVAAELGVPLRPLVVDQHGESPPGELDGLGAQVLARHAGRRTR
ncbi:hypothetical protein [Actinomadura madurae]|uniref:hypothetical protein n=1 Tax=Actinomadura madurae TaxID=1993 RepID=UPI0020D22E94|nr:hypothetical protein [Actinomadura madurae]MCQ0012942.1 hypothetical protein [Actinomadura madurae]